MPILELEEAVETQRKPLDPAEEKKKPVICVFDPIHIHDFILGFVLAELLDKVEIFWQSQFSRTYVELGGISEEMYPSLIAVKKPVLLISELEIIPGEHLYGIEMLQNLRRAVGLKDTPLVVISNKNCLAKAEEELRNKPKELKIDETFFWSDLESSPNEQERLFDVVSKILDLKREP